MALTKSGKNYYENIGVDALTSSYYKPLADATEEEHEEIASIVDGVSDIFEHTSDLKTMKFKQKNEH